MPKSYFLSLIVPAYNEEKILKANLNEIINFLSAKKYAWEIVVVDDGSRDSTYKIAKSLEKKGVRAFRLVKNRGKGAALKEGFRNARGRYQIFSDADVSVPISTIDHFIKKLQDGYDVVIGSRRTKGSDIVIHQPWLRENMGRVFTAITKLITGNNLTDFTCGFKGFTLDAALEIFKRSQIERWAYDAEILFLAKKFKYKIYEYPVKWTNRKETRVKLTKVVIPTFIDLLKIRLNNLSSLYAKED